MLDGLNAKANGNLGWLCGDAPGVPCSYYQWVFFAIAVVALLWITKRLFHISPKDFIVTIMREIGDLAKGLESIGSINALGLIGMLVLGTLIVILANLGHLRRLILSFVSGEKADIFQSSVQLEIFFLGFLIFALVSVWVVHRHRE